MCCWLDEESEPGGQSESSREKLAITQRLLQKSGGRGKPRDVPKRPAADDRSACPSSNLPSDLRWERILPLPKSDLEHSRIVTSSPCSARVRFIEPCFQGVVTTTFFEEDDGDCTPPPLLPEPAEAGLLVEHPETPSSRLPCPLMGTHQLEEMHDRTASQATPSIRAISESKQQRTEACAGDSPKCRQAEDETSTDGGRAPREGDTPPDEAIVCLPEGHQLFCVFTGTPVTEADGRTLPGLSGTERLSRLLWPCSGKKETRRTSLPSDFAKNCRPDDTCDMAALSQPTSSAFALSEDSHKICSGETDRNVGYTRPPPATIVPLPLLEEDLLTTAQCQAAAVPPRTKQVKPFPPRHFCKGASLPSFPPVPVNGMEGCWHFCTELPLFFSDLSKHDSAVC